MNASITYKPYKRENGNELKTIKVKNFQGCSQKRPEEASPYFIIVADGRAMFADGELVSIDKLYGEWNEEKEQEKKSQVD